MVRNSLSPQNRGWFKQSQWQPMSSDGWGRFTATGFSIYVPYQSISNIEVLPIEKFVQDPLHVRPCIAHSPRQPINCGFKTGPPNVAPETRQVPRTISIVMGVPKDGWFIVENPNLKWMMTGGTPMTQETSRF